MEEMVAENRTPQERARGLWVETVATLASLSERTAVYVAAILLMPLLLMAINDSWVGLMPSRTYIDPYIYTGYFLHLSDYLRDFPHAYYTGRLPWLLTGSLVNDVVPPLTATYLLRLLLMWTSALSLFVTIRILFANNLGAAIGAVLLLTCTSFIRGVGWDYVDGPAISFALLTTALLTIAARTPYWRPVLLLAGAAQLAMLVQYVVLSPLIPLHIAWFLVLNWTGKKRPVVLSLTLIFVGGAVALTGLCLTNWMLGGRFFFFQSQVAITESLVTAPVNRTRFHWVDNASWNLASYVALGSGVLAVALGGRLRDWRSRVALDSPLLVVVLQFAALLATGLALQIYGYAFFRNPDRATVFLPFAFIALGGVVAAATSSVRPAWRLPLLAGVAALLLAPFAVDVLRPERLCGPGCNFVGWLGVLTVLSAALLFVAVRFRSGAVLLAAVAFFSIANIDIADHRTFTFTSGDDLRVRKQLVFDTDAAASSFDPGGNYRIWYDLKDAHGDVFRTFASMHLYAYRLLGEDFPGRRDPLARSKQVNLNLGQGIILLSSRPDALAVADQGLASLHIQAESIATTHIARGTHQFDVYYVKLIPSEVAPYEPLALDDLTAGRSGTVTPNASGVLIQTAPTPWNYAALMTIPKHLLTDNPDSVAFIKVRLTVRRGPIGVGVFKFDQSDFIGRQSVSEAPGVQEIYIRIPRLGDVGPLVFQTWDQSVAGEIALEAISIQVIPAQP